MKTQWIANPNAKTTLIFLHGFCCSPNDFRAQIERFKKHNSILLPDYSDAVEHCKPASAQMFSWCVAELKKTIEEKKLAQFILVGHSLGGTLALALAGALKSGHLGTVVIDSNIPMTDEKRGQYQAIFTGLRSENGEKVLATLFDQKWTNVKYDQAPLMKQKKEELVSTWKKSRENFTELMETAVQFDSASALKKHRAPALYVAAEPSGGDVEAIKKINPKIEIAHIASGHFIMQNAPEQMNAILETFFVRLTKEIQN